MADERRAYAATLCADQIGKTVAGTDRAGHDFSGVVQSVTHLPAGENLEAVTGVKLLGGSEPIILTGREEVTVS